MITGMGLIFALGCTQATPSISQTENLPAIILDQTAFESKNIELLDITLSGRVSKFVSALEVSFDGGQNWSALENSAQSALKIDLASCTVNCQFNYSVSNVGQKWSMLLQLPFGAEAQGLVRGSSLYGYTEPTAFRIKRLKRGFVSIGSIGLNRLGAGSKTLSGNFKVLGGKLEAQKIVSKSLSDGSTNITIHTQGVAQ